MFRSTTAGRDAGLIHRGCDDLGYPLPQKEEVAMKLKIVVHEAEEGGYWAEVPAIPGCATQGDTFEVLLGNLYEAVDACLSVELEEVEMTDRDRVLEIAV